MPDGDEKVFMKAWDNWTQEEFLLFFSEPCWIEPDFGWAIVQPNRIVYYSLGVSRTWFQRKPNLLKFLRRKNIIKLKMAISLRDSGEENYFHFYNDVLSKLFFLQHHGVDVKVHPVIVKKKLWDKEYFQYFREHVPLLKSLHWIIQDEQYIQCDSVYFCKPLTHRLDLWNDILKFFPAISSTHSYDRIFLTRQKGRLRFLENMNEIETVCRAHRLVVLDTDELNLEEQVKAFANAKLIVGIHGAGLTNIVFCRNACTVLELFPPPEYDYLPYHYMMLAIMRGNVYRAMIGEPGHKKYSGGFCISPEKLSRELSNIVV